jgi:hypothetical protein
MFHIGIHLKNRERDARGSPILKDPGAGQNDLQDSRLAGATCATQSPHHLGPDAVLGAAGGAAETSDVPHESRQFDELAILGLLDLDLGDSRAHLGLARLAPEQALNALALEGFEGSVPSLSRLSPSQCLEALALGQPADLPAQPRST